MGVKLIKHGSHKADVAIIRAAIERNGGRIIQFDRADGPDLVMEDRKGMKWGVEVERTLKSSARYRAVLEAHRDRLLIGDYKRLVFLCPKQWQVEALAKRLRNLTIAWSGLITVGRYELVYEL